MGIGEKFREERLKQGYSLEAVEDETKIRKYYLEAIEEENFNLLPAKVYATGFVKRYAKFLNLNEQESVELFKNAAYGKEEAEDLYDIKPPTRSLEPRSNISWRNVIIAIVFLVVVIWTGDYLIAYFTSEHKLPPNSKTPIVEMPNGEDGENSGEIIIDNDNKPPMHEGVEIKIIANQKCWLSIIVDGEEQYNAILPVGETLTFNGDDKIYLKAGNAGGIVITYNGEEMPLLGQTGEVKEATYTSF